MYSAAKYVLLFIIYSALGGLVETLYRLATEHHLYGVHGFLNLPILPIYGFGALAIIAIGRHFRHPVTLFIFGGLAATIIEFVASWVIEMVFGIRIWNYANDALSLWGRVRLTTAIGFSLCGVLLVYVVHPRVEKLMKKLPKHTLMTAAAILGSVVLVDIVFSVIARLMWYWG